MKSDKNTPERIIPNLVVGIILGIAFSSQVLDFRSTWGWILIYFVCFILAGYLLARLLIKVLILPNLQKNSFKVNMVWVLTCLLGGFLLVMTIPITIYPKPNILRIIATGEKNVQAKSSEIWLNRIFTDGKALSLHQSACEGDWKRIDSNLVSVVETQPSELLCILRTDRDINIQLGMHAWSGKAEILFGNSGSEEDLYAKSSNNKIITYRVPLTPNEKILRNFLFFADGLSIGLILLALSLGLVAMTDRFIHIPRRRFPTWYFYTLVLVDFWMIYLLAFWPGFFSPDTVSQFNQIASGEYSDWHPAFHTFFLWLSTRIWFSPTPAIVIQIFTLGGITGWGLSLIGRKGAPLWLTWLITLFLAVSPAVGLILLNPWKDVAFGISVVTMTFMIFHIILGEEMNKPVGYVFWILFAVVTVFVALFRHNGPLVALGTLAVLFVFDRPQRKFFLSVMILGAVIYLAIKGPLYKVLDVNLDPEKKGENLVAISSALYLLDFHAKSGSVLMVEEKDMLSQMYREDGTVRLDLLGRYANEIVRIAFSLSLRNPFVTASYLLNRSSYIFQILEPPGVRVGFVEMAIYPNSYQISPASKLLFLQPYITKLTAISESPAWSWLFWRNAFWMYILIFAGMIASIKFNEWRYLAVITPVVLNAVPIAFVSGGHISRYIFPSLILGPILGIGLLFLQLQNLPQDHLIDDER